MPHSRREFMRALGATGSLIPLSVVAAACTSDDGSDSSGTSLATSSIPKNLQTTLDATIALVGGSGYRALHLGAGEPFLTRDDLGVSGEADREKNRRSILYFGQLSDTHVIDSQTPSRADWSFGILQNESAFRAQETMSVQVLAEMVVAVNALKRSVVSGAPSAVTVITGDLADSHATTEMNWYLETLAGGEVLANSGKKNEYQGVQVWDECTYAYHPENPSKDQWGENGYPAVPGMLAAAVSNKVTSEGLTTPWLSVLGNHDATWMGTFGRPSAPMNELAVGSSKIALPPPDVDALFKAMTNPSDKADQAVLAAAIKDLHNQPGVRQVEADPERKEFTRKEIIDAHFDIDSSEGPNGHGFTEESRVTGDAWWTWQVGPAVRFLGLDSNNQYFGYNGSIPQPQWEWLESELQAHSSRYLDSNGNVVEHDVTDQLMVVLSHHTSWTMDNTAAAPGDTTKLHSGDDLVALLLRYPNAVAWCNGHTHANTIVPHTTKSTKLGGGFWEINTPSCIDWGQQSRMVEIMDNRDGTLSLFTLTVDHAAPAEVKKGDLGQQNLASLSREMAANPWFWDAAKLLGTPEDRNTELMIKAPFDLTDTSDKDLADHALKVNLRSLEREHAVAS